MLITFATYMKRMFDRFFIKDRQVLVGFENYLQTAWGDSSENVTISDVKTAIAEMMKVDDEHGAFWVGVSINGENVLEVSKDSTLIAVFEDAPDTQIKRRGKSWNEVERLYQLLLDGNIEALKTALNS